MSRKKKKGLGSSAKTHRAHAETYINLAEKWSRHAADAANGGDCYEALNHAASAREAARAAGLSAGSAKDRSLREAASHAQSRAAHRFDSILRACARKRPR